VIVTATPLPECRRCGAPMRRQRWAVTAGICSRCRTAREAIATGHRAARLAVTRETAERQAEDRITRLAARRAARQGADGAGGAS
jgi:Zn finger protein HypA/HybF involved in hydrogenase expression